MNINYHKKKAEYGCSSQVSLRKFGSRTFRKNDKQSSFSFSYNNSQNHNNSKKYLSESIEKLPSSPLMQKKVKYFDAIRKLPQKSITTPISQKRSVKLLSNLFQEILGEKYFIQQNVLQAQLNLNNLRINYFCENQQKSWYSTYQTESIKILLNQMQSSQYLQSICVFRSQNSYSPYYHTLQKIFRKEFIVGLFMQKGILKNIINQKVCLTVVRQFLPFLIKEGNIDKQKLD